MTHVDSLRKLERTLESFLERAIRHKESRLNILDSINRLDEIARAEDAVQTVDAVGDWFARHNPQLNQGELRQSDINRIGEILCHIKTRLEDRTTPETVKLRSEIDRWNQAAQKGRHTIIFKRGPEKAAVEDDSITLFTRVMARTSGLFLSKSKGCKHLISVLEQSLDIAESQKSREALLLSGFIIYYLKIGGYKVEPFVKRLKQAERIHKEPGSHA